MRAEGATVVEVLDEQITASHSTLDHARWTPVQVDVAGAGDEIDVLERAEAALHTAVGAADGRLVAARIEISGVTTAPGVLVRERERLDSELRGLATDVGTEQVWLERIDWQTSMPRTAAVCDEAVGETLKVLRAAGQNARAIAALADGLRPLALKLPAEVKAGPDGIDPTDHERSSVCSPTCNALFQACSSPGGPRESALDRFELRAFGPFTNTVLELRDAPRGGLHIICGPNEIGKTTGRRGIGDFLFGIPPRSTDNQLHAYVDMRLVAMLVDGRGRRHELIRRKGSRSTLLGPDNEPVDEAVLAGMLGGMTRDVFESMFSITHESLVVGGKALLAADGDLGESLFSASLGATGLHELRAELEREAGELFRPRATSSLIFQVRAAFEGAQAKLREDTLRATTCTEHERQLNVARAERDQVAQQIRSARAAQNARERLRTVIPLLARHEQIGDERADLAETPELGVGAAERRARAVQRAADATRAGREASSRVATLKERIGQLEDAPALLNRELAIRELQGRLGNVREGVGDLERQRVKLQTAEGMARRALDQVRS